MSLLINAFKYAAGMQVPAPQIAGAAMENIRLGDQGEEGNRLLRARLVAAVASLGGLGENYLTNVSRRLGLKGDLVDSSKPLTEREIKAVITEAELMSVQSKLTMAKQLAALEQCDFGNADFGAMLNRMRSEAGQIIGQTGLRGVALEKCMAYLEAAMNRCLAAVESLEAEARTPEVRQDIAKVFLFEAQHVTGVATKAANGVDDEDVLNMLSVLGGLSSFTVMLDGIAQVARSQAKARLMFAKADAMEAKAELAATKAKLEEFIEDLEEQIKRLEKLLAGEGDDEQAEEMLEEDVAETISTAIQQKAEEVEELVSGFEARIEEIREDKREGVQA